MKLFKDLKEIKPDLDNTPLRFGKHKGLTPEQVAKIDPGWIAWAYANLNSKPFSKTLALACEDAVRDSEHLDYEDDSSIFDND